MHLSIRHLQEQDFEKIIDYFLLADESDLLRMGVDRAKLPSKEKWVDILRENFELPLEQKKLFYIIWMIDGEAAGHSNINKIIFGEEAYMHLHMWKSSCRQSGIGVSFLKKTIPIYFETFHLKRLFCEPAAFNTAPNKTLPKLGFELIKTHETIPGWIAFPQQVNQWCLTEEKIRTVIDGWKKSE